jgi:hypothetical protein
MVTREALPAVGGGELVTRITPIIAALLSLAAGCTDLTEFDGTYSAGLYVISTSDLSVTASAGPISNARSVCSMAGRIWVATTDGRILDYDTTTMELAATRMVGTASPSAYSEMVFSPMENSVYLIGPFGSLLEIGFPDGSVEEEFSVCEAPKMLVVDDDGPFLYVSDAATDRILEIRLETNHQSRMCQLSSQPVCMCNSEDRIDTLVAGTLAGSVLLSTTGSGIIRQWRFDESLILAVTGIPGDSIHCAVRRSSGGDEVVTLRSFFPDSMGGNFGWTGAVQVAGDTHFISPGTDMVHAYVLSYIGGSTSRLVSYDHENYRIDGTLDLPGYPMDMEMTPGGNLVILTVE